MCSPAVSSTALFSVNDSTGSFCGTSNLNGPRNARLPLMRRPWSRSTSMLPLPCTSWSAAVNFAVAAPASRRDGTLSWMLPKSSDACVNDTVAAGSAMGHGGASPVTLPARRPSGASWSVDASSRTVRSSAGQLKKSGSTRLPCTVGSCWISSFGASCTASVPPICRRSKPMSGRPMVSRQLPGANVVSGICATKRPFISSACWSEMASVRMQPRSTDGSWGMVRSTSNAKLNPLGACACQSDQDSVKAGRCTWVTPRPKPASCSRGRFSGTSSAGMDRPLVLSTTLSRAGNSSCWSAGTSGRMFRRNAKSNPELGVYASRSRARDDSLSFSQPRSAVAPLMSHCDWKWSTDRPLSPSDRSSAAEHGDGPPASTASSVAAVRL